MSYYYASSQVWLVVRMECYFITRLLYCWADSLVDTKTKLSKYYENVLTWIPSDYLYTPKLYGSNREWKSFVWTKQKKKNRETFKKMETIGRWCSFLINSCSEFQIVIKNYWILCILALQFNGNENDTMRKCLYMRSSSFQVQ